MALMVKILKSFIDFVCFTVKIYEHLGAQLS